MTQALANRQQTFAVDFTPKNLHEAMELAKIMADSDLVPKDFQKKPGNVLVAIQMGAEIGLKPMQAIQNIAVINGRPTVWGDAALGVVQSSDKLESFNELDETEALKQGFGRTELKRKGNKEPIVSTFSIEDAKKANLWGKTDPWTQYPGRMLKLRARAFALRNGFADVLKGLAIREEVEDYSEPRDVTPRQESIAMPRRVGAEAQAEAQPKPQDQPKSLNAEVVDPGTITINLGLIGLTALRDRKTNTMKQAIITLEKEDDKLFLDTSTAQGAKLLILLKNGKEMGAFAKLVFKTDENGVRNITDVVPV